MVAVAKKALSAYPKTGRARLLPSRESGRSDLGREINFPHAGLEVVGAIIDLVIGDGAEQWLTPIRGVPQRFPFMRTTEMKSVFASLITGGGSLLGHLPAARLAHSLRFNPFSSKTKSHIHRRLAGLAIAACSVDRIWSTGGAARSWPRRCRRSFSPSPYALPG